MAQGSRECSEL